MRTSVRRAMAGMLIGAALAAAGCQNKKPKEITIIDDSAVRTDESRRMVMEADKEQNLARAAQAAYDDKGWNAHSQKAIELYRAAIDRSKDMFPAWNNLGTLLMDRGAYMDAAQCFETAAGLSETDPRPYYNLGVIYQITLHDREALDYFLKSLARDPRYLPSLRGAMAAGKRMDVTDEAALKRVRAGLMLETDPKWRSIFETESLRIEGSLTRATRSSTGL